MRKEKTKNTQKIIIKPKQKKLIQPFISTCRIGEYKTNTKKSYNSKAVRCQPNVDNQLSLSEI